MIKVTLFLTRRSDLSRQEFSDYWRNKHWPLVRALPEVEAHLLRYVQQHAVDGLPDGLPAASYDGVAEAWFDDLESAMALMGSENWGPIVAADEENFLDRSKTRVMISTELVDYQS